jgi:predicted nucleic acid-binding protein
MIKIYLDQNIWINLSRVYFGIDKNSELSDICNRLLKASNEGYIICPLSVSHIIESLKKKNIDRRKRFAEFIIKVSKGYTILPYSKIIPWEIKNAVYGLLDKEKLNLSDIAIGRGISHSLGAKGVISGNISKKIKDMIMKELESPDTLKMILSGENPSGSYQNDNSEAKMKESELVINIEKIRKEENKIKDSELRYRYCAAKHFRQIILPVVVSTLNDLGIPFQPIFDDMTKEQVFDFFKQIPTSFCDFTLTYRRNRNADRPIRGNDLFDIAALSIAIPYCDIVVAEKMFSSLAIQSKLDELYKTKIYQNIRKLKNDI